MKHSELTIGGYAINKKSITEKQLDKIKKNLHVKPKICEDYGQESIEFDVYKEIGDKIYIPRNYGIKNFGNPANYKNDDCKKINITFNGKLRDNQMEIANICISKAKEHGGGILQLPCGSGKTIISIYIASILGLKTLIITHKSFLQEQWIDRFNEFTNAQIGLIRQDKIITKEKDVVVGMLHSISMIDYDMNIFNDFGLVIYDEVHHMGARVFSNALFKTGFKYSFGLSATPQRSDGMMKIINWFIGDILYKMERNEDKNVEVKSFLYETNETNFIEKKAYIKGKGILKTNLPSSLTCLSKVVSRNLFIIQIIDAVMKNSNRKILILSARLEHLKNIKEQIDKNIEININNGIYEKDEYKTYYYIGANTQKERRMAEIEGDIIFATYDMASEALDIPRMNTIIMITPPISKKMFVQSIGRCMRQQNTIINPLIIDIMDQLPIYDKLAKIRSEYYNKYKYSNMEIYVNSDKIITKRNYLKNKYNMTDLEIDKEFGCGSPCEICKNTAQILTNSREECCTSSCNECVCKNKDKLLDYDANIYKIIN